LLSRARWLRIIDMLAPADAPKITKPLDGSAPSEDAFLAACHHFVSW
jgi:hypothetical protein